MKPIIPILVTCFMLVSASMSSAQQAAHKFIDQVKQEQSAITMTLPGWLIRSGIKMAAQEDLKDANGLKDIVNGIKQLRFAVIDNGDVVQASHISKLVQLSTEVDGMQEYVRVKEDGRYVTVMMKEEDDRVKNILIVSTGDDEFAIVNVKTNISLTDLENADFSFNSKRNSHN